MKPAFLRFPGGNYLEGPNYENRFNWKETIGPIEQRPTHMSPWSYRSSDGMGLLEFLEWAEDLNMEPILAALCRSAHRQRREHHHGRRAEAARPGRARRDRVHHRQHEHDLGRATRERRPSAAVQAPLCRNRQRRLAELGDARATTRASPCSTTRSKRSTPTIKIISTMRTQDRNFVHTPQAGPARRSLLHDIPTALAQAHLYDNYIRSATKIFVGEWATNNPRIGRYADDGVRARRCGVAHGPGAQRRCRHHELLRAAVRECEPGRHVSGRSTSLATTR